MGKKGTPTKAAPAISSEVQARVNELRAEAQTQFLKKEFNAAATFYQQAIQLLPDCDIKAELLQKKVGCLINLKKYKEAAREASAVLQLSPNSPGALKSRARAYEQLGQYKQALADMQAVNRTDAATPETRDSEKRLKELAAGGSRPSRPASASSAGSRAPVNAYQLSFKATLGSDTKMLHTGLTVSYAELMELVREKFPNAGPVCIKYTDKDGDVVTISSRHDIQLALGDLVATYQRQLQGGHAPRMTGLPALKIQVVPVASEADVPRPPLAELAERAGTAASDNGASTGQQQVPYEGEDWLLDFARLFSEVTSLDPAAHFEHHQQANEKLQRAMLDTVHAPEADELFDLAGEHFRDAVVTSYIQWGNTHLMKADRKLRALKEAADAEGGKALQDADLSEVMQQYDLTEQRIQEALKVYPDSWDANAALGQVEWERAKARMGYVLPHAPPPSDESEQKTPEQLAEQQAAQTKQTEAVLAAIPKDKVALAKESLDKVNKIFDKALAAAHQAHETKQQRDAARAAKAAAKDGTAEAPENGTASPAADDKLPVTSAPSNVLIMHGNIMYELSQVYAATGVEPWRPLLDEAATKFRASGALEADVRNALKNHLKKDELDLGPEPEAPATPVKEAPSNDAKVAEEAAPASVPEPSKEVKDAKGLPSLERKTKAAKK